MALLNKKRFEEQRKRALQANVSFNPSTISRPAGEEMLKRKRIVDQVIKEAIHSATEVIRKRA